MARCAEFSAAGWLQCANNFAPLSLRRTKPMATVHTEIDNWLAADLHGDLSDAERSALHAHLLDCAACRKAHQETKTMNKILEETLAQEKPDLHFEQRMLGGFRNRVPQRAGLVRLLVDLMRLRPVQITAVAAVLLGLVQLGRMITGEDASAVPGRKEYTRAQFAAQPSQVAASQPALAAGLARSDEAAAARSRDLALPEPPPPALPSTQASDNAESFAKSKPMTGTESKLADQRAQPAAPPGEAQGADKKEQRGKVEVERVIATGSLIPTAEEVSAPPTNAALANRKLIRNATAQLEKIGRAH